MKLYKIFSLISALIVITGACFKVLHYKHGDTFIYVGMLAQIISQSYHIDALEKLINKNEEIGN